MGAIEALEVLMGFHQNQMSRHVIFLHTEAQPTQRMLKPQAALQAMKDEDPDIYLQTKCVTLSSINGGVQQQLLNNPALTFPPFLKFLQFLQKE